MACMKLGSKADAFQRQGQAWFCTTGLPSDIVVEVEDMSFHLHKFPLLSRSGVMERLIAEASEQEDKICTITLPNIPGGAKTFELVAKFCYGVKHEITASNVVHLRCAAEHLEMTEEYGEDNLISQTETFFNQTVLKNWKDSLKSLQSIPDLPHAEELNITKRCIDSLAVKASTDPNLFGWPVVDHRGPMQSPGGSVLWNGISTGARPKNVSSDWWYDDASSLSLPLYKRLISAMEVRGIKQEIIAGSLEYYAKKYLPGLTRRKSAPAGHQAEPPPEEDQKILLEEIDRLLPVQKGLVSTTFLFGLLRTGLILRASPNCVSNLEKRIGLQLDQATLEDLLMPNFSYSMETLYNIDCVQRMLEHFMAMDQATGGASPCSIEDDEQLLGSPSLTPVTMVAKLIDGYLAEVAPDVNLKLPKFQSLAGAVPEYARPLDDGLYRAIDIYLKSHPWLADSDREQLCRLMDCQKLSLEACTHAAQNERLPLRIIVQVLFFEQLQLRTSIAGCFLVSDNLADGSRQLRSGVVSAQEGGGGGWNTAVRENQVLKVGMDSMRMRVSELEKECSNMKQEIEKLGRGKGGSGGGGGGGSSPSSSTPASGTRRQSTRSRSAISIGNSGEKDTPQEKNASSSKGKGKAVLKPSQDEGRGGPHTRNASRRRAASDKDTSMKSVDDESSSEDEDVDISPVDIDDALVIEDDEISEDDDDDDHDDVLRDDSLPVYMPYVHDVKLTDSTDNTTLAGPTTSDSHTKSRSTPARGSDSTDYRGPTSFSSRGSMSFAAAAMAGLASANARAVRGGSGGGRDRHNHSTPRLSFSSNGKQLNRHLTIYQAIQQQLVLDEGDNDQYNTDGSKLWNDIYTITYQKADINSQKTTNLTKPGSTCQMSLLDSILQGELPCDMEKDNPTYNILSLLRVLEGLNQLAPRLRIETVIDQFSEGKISSVNDIITPGVRVLSDEFLNSKLTPKLSRQIQDVLALCSGSLPSWCYQLTKACPFLFPFETRRQYFYSTAFGLSRALHRLQQQGADGHGLTTERELRVRRLSRQKVRVSRNRILESAAKVMEMYSSQKAVLEVEYFGEVGTGLGPTLEFYTLLSHDLQRTGLKMWRCNNSGDGSVAMEVEVEEKKDDLGDIVISPLGLFPRPWVESSCDGKLIEHFWLFGCVMAKALQDGRLLDMPLSTAFYKLVLGQELDLHDVSSFDAELGKTLQELQAIVCRKKYLESTPRHDCNAILDLNFRGAPVEDLCLDFTLPGFPDYILKPGNEDVSIDNLEEYISLVVAATVKTGITRQMEAFRAGFNQVFDISALQIFTPNELDHLLCGQRELWEADKLVDHIKFDHGYTSKSPAIVNLLEIMGEFTPEQQRAFCQFVTGAPRLPPGGLAILNPKLTIVRKHSSTSSSVTSSAGGASESADDDLPSVMTCANYLKLPAYSTKEIMYKQLVYAISEGQGSFDLS